MKLVYVAGPYRAKTMWGVEQNIRKAEAVGMEIAKSGLAYPVIPHCNTRGYFEETQGDQFWLEGTLELMRKCDAVMLTEGWEKSSGTRGEIKEAWRISLPVFDDLVDLDAFLVGKDDFKEVFSSPSFDQQFGPLPPRAAETLGFTDVHGA